MKKTYFGKTKRFVSAIAVLAAFALLVSLMSVTAFAAEGDAPQAAEAAQDNATGSKAIAAGIAVGVAALAGALGMAIAIGKSVESMARQPEASGKINSAMMLGLVFIETTIIYALIVAILIIFVL